jgi:steroid delta-isomerase-like uncharacterized protein
MSVEENVALMKRWFQEVWNEGRKETIFELLAENAVGHGQMEDGSEIRGPAGFMPLFERLRGAFPDIKIVVEQAFGVEDQVVVRWSATMTHRGDDLGVPASGKTVRLGGVTMVRIRDGQVVEGWDNWDQLGMLRQIGLYGSSEKLLKSA